MRGAWFMELGAAQGFLPLINQLRAGKFEAAASLFKNKKKENAPYAVGLTLEPGAKVHKTNRYSSFNDAEPGSVAVIPVVGPMMSQDFCGSLGTQTLGRLLQEADAHPNIVGHVLWFDTPGGSVAGTETFSALIASTQKPAVAFVANMMASAGYWAGSSANHIMLSGQTAMVGSIGTMLEITDSRKADELEGNTQIMVRADESGDKNEAFIQLLDGNQDPIKQQLLNPLNAVFQDSVRANRAGKLPTGKDAENVLSGKVYLAADAVKFGLADSIGTFPDAVQLALDLAAKTPGAGAPKVSPNSLTTNPSMAFNLKAKWGALLTAAGIQPDAAAATQLTEAHLEQLNATTQAQSEQLTTANNRLATLATERDQAQESLSAKELELTTATAKVTELETAAQTHVHALATANTQVTTLTAEVARLGKQPGQRPTNPLNPNAEDNNDLPKADPIVDPNASHNKFAARFFAGK